MTSLVISAHSDDEVIGVGGTIAKLSKNEDVYVLIFKYGADLPGILTSWPFTNKKKLREVRIKEARKADKYLGVKRTIFLGLEGDLEKNWNATHHANVIKIIKEINPNKIFVHSSFDVHRDHLFVNKKINQILNELDINPEVYYYDINLWKKSLGEPNIIMDISKYFGKKMKALTFFKSQIFSIIILEPLIYLKAINAGRMIGKKYGEVFYKS